MKQKPEKQRGRKAGSSLIIKDALLEPYNIKVDPYSFVVMKEGENNPYGFFPKLSSAITTIIKQQVNANNHNSVLTLAEFAKEWQIKAKKLAEQFDSVLDLSSVAYKKKVS